MLPPHLRSIRLSRQGKRLLQVIGNLNLFALRKRHNVGAPLEGDFIALLPGVDVLAVEFVTDHGRDCACQLGAAPERSDELCMSHTQNIGHIVRLVNADFPRDHSKGCGDNSHVKNFDPFNVECGQRLVTARTALGYEKRRSFARLTLDSETEDDLFRSEDRLKTWESGRSMVPPWYVAKLRQLFGISADWIYSGDISGLPHEMAQKILQQQQD